MSQPARLEAPALAPEALQTRRFGPDSSSGPPPSPAAGSGSSGAAEPAADPVPLGTAQWAATPPGASWAQHVGLHAPPPPPPPSLPAARPFGNPEQTGDWFVVTTWRPSQTPSVSGALNGRMGMSAGTYTDEAYGFGKLWMFKRCQPSLSIG